MLGAGHRFGKLLGGAEQSDLKRLTGLYNPSADSGVMQQAMTGVLSLRATNFMQGLEGGNNLLQSFASMLQRRFCRGKLVARYGWR